MKFRVAETSTAIYKVLCNYTNKCNINVKVCMYCVCLLLQSEMAQQIQMKFGANIAHTLNTTFTIEL